MDRPRGTRVAAAPRSPRQYLWQSPTERLISPAEIPIRRSFLSWSPALRTLQGGQVRTPRRVSRLLFAAAEFEADEIPARATAVVSGALDGIERILREHVRVGDHVGIEDPSFGGIVALLCGCVPTPIALDEHGPNPDAVDQALKQGAGQSS